MDAKWRCVSCSHTNWLAAPHCGSCYKPRKDDEFNGISLQNSSRLCEDNIIINQTSPSRCRKGKGNLVTAGAGYGYGGSVREAVAGRWICSECNSENVNNSRFCCQCKSARTKKVAGAQAPGAAQCSDNTADVWSQSRPRRKSRRPHGREKRAAPTSGNPHATASPLPCHQDASKAKWACGACTFENWPRTSRCAMCDVDRKSGAGAPSASGSGGDHHSQSSSGGEGDGPGDVTVECKVNDDRRLVASNTVASVGSSDQIIACQSAPSSASRESRSPDGVHTDSRVGRSRQRTSSPSEVIAQQRNRMSPQDAQFVAACAGVASGDVNAIRQYLLDGGDCTRILTRDEALLLNNALRRKQSNEQGTVRMFVPSETLVHMALGFERSDLLTMLLSGADQKRVRKRLPSYAMQGVADEVRQEMSTCLQQMKGAWPCCFISRDCLFALPEEISSFTPAIREQLFHDVVDTEVQQELEDSKPPVINWCDLITDSLGTKLYALWNRTQGDCLLDSILQTTWGVQDRSASLRIALSESLNEGKARFYERWRDAEVLQANSLQYSVDENQWRLDFEQLQVRASTSGVSLEQLHVFALAHILRRPIIVYGIKYVKSFRGDNLGLARFQGVYLPLLWDPDFCWCSPVSLAYTRGHFSALVPMQNCMTPMSPTDLLQEPSAQRGSATSSSRGSGRPVKVLDRPQSHAASSADGGVAWLPLVDAQDELLPVHFLTMDEMGREEELLHRWLDCFAFNGCRLAARQVMPPQHHLVESLVESWLSHYRRMATRDGSPGEATPPADDLPTAYAAGL